MDWATWEEYKEELPFIEQLISSSCKIHRSEEKFLRMAPMMRVHALYGKIVADVMGDMKQQAWF